VSKLRYERNSKVKLIEKLEELQRHLRGLGKPEAEPEKAGVKPIKYHKRLEALVKERTAELRAEREQLLSIFDSINEIIYVADPYTYEILYANKALKDAFHKDLVGGICYREFQGFDKPCDFCTNEIILKNEGQPYQWEYHNPILDRHFMIIDRMIKWPDGRNVRFELATDITERKQAEEALKEREERYRFLTNNVKDMIALYRFKPTRGFDYVSPSAVEITGYTPQEFYDDPDLGSKLVHPEDRHLFEAITRGELGQEKPLTLRWIRRDGSTIWVEPRSTPIYGESGDLVAIEGVARDVTERKRAEEKLLLLSRVVELSVDSIVISDLTGKITYVNEATLKTYGTEEERDLVGKSSFDFIVPEDKERALAGMAETLEKGYLTKREYQVFRKDGTRIPVEMSTAVIRDNRENPIGYAGIIRDITERKQAEEALKESEQSLRSITQIAKDAIIMIDYRGNICFWNPAAEEMFGYSEQEAMGKELQLLLAPSRYHDAYKKGFAAFKDTGKGPAVERTLELMGMRKDGTEFPTELSLSAIKRGEGWYGVGIVRDITERKLMQERLENINRLFLNLGPDLMENIDRIIHAAKDILDGALVTYSRLEGGRLSILSTAPGEEAFTVSEGLDSYIYNELISRDAREPLVVKDLRKTPYAETQPEIVKYRLVSFAGYPVERHEEVIGCLGLFCDEERGYSRNDLETLGTLARAISIEEERLAREEGLKNFIDIASHELRHPITLIKGYTLSLKNFWDKFDDDKKLKLLQSIDYGTDRIEKLSRDLLETSYIERGRFRLDRREVPLKSLIERAVSEMREKGLKNRFKLSIAEDIGNQKVDPERFAELMIILLDNAVTFSPPGSDIDIEAKTGDGGTLISVLDRGQGIPERDIERIFDRFHQVGEAIHHSKPGMGMGLYIAKEIVEAHGGRIWCEPRQGGGSVFYFTIPND